MGLSEAFAQGGWVRALWSEMVLGLSPQEWRGREEVTPLISVTDLIIQLRLLAQWNSQAPVKTGGVPLVCQSLGKTFPDHGCSCGGLMVRARVADALTKLHGNGDLLRAVCRQAFTELVEAPKIMTASRQKKGRNAKEYRESSHH